MSLDGRAVANFVLDFCDARGRRITNLSLQKIVYFCHVWSLIRLCRPLVKHQFEAWQFGPVLQYLYREFKEFDSRPIVGRAKKIDPGTGNSTTVEYRLDGETEELLRRVVDFYSLLNPADLVQMTHAKGGPWDTVWNHQGRVMPGMKIDNTNIVEYYCRVNPPFMVQ
jgi:uncharacterized phage-associated protein